MMRLALFSIALLATTTLGQTRYVDDTHHWYLEIPAGWEAASAERVEAINSELLGRIPDRNFDFVAYFHPQGEPTSPLYIIVQFTNVPLKGASYADAERAFKASSWERSARETIKSKFSDVITAADFSTPTLDRESNRVFIDISAAVPDGPELKGRCVLHLASHGVVQLNFYSPTQDFSNNLPVLQDFLAGFGIDAPYRFVARADHSTSGFDWQKVLDKAIVGGVVGGILGGLAVIFRMRAKHSDDGNRAPTEIREIEDAKQESDRRAHLMKEAGARSWKEYVDLVGAEHPTVADRPGFPKVKTGHPPADSKGNVL